MVRRAKTDDNDVVVDGGSTIVQDVSGTIVQSVGPMMTPSTVIMNNSANSDPAPVPVVNTEYDFTVGDAAELILAHGNFTTISCVVIHVDDPFIVVRGQHTGGTFLISRANILSWSITGNNGNEDARLPLYVNTLYNVRLQGGNTRLMMIDSIGTKFIKARSGNVAVIIPFSKLAHITL